MSARGTLWPLISGFSAWAIAFALVYALNGLGCASGWHLIGTEPFTLHRLILAAASVLGILGVGAMLLPLRRTADVGPHGFVREAGFWLAAIALVASAITFAPVLILSTCAV